MKTDTLLLLDCYGVLFDELAPFVFNLHFNTEDAVKFKNQIFLPADSGDYGLDVCFDKMQALFQISREQLLSEWNSFIRCNDELVNYIRSIKNDVTIGLVSNACQGINEELFERFHLNDLFDKQFISYQYHIQKPDHKIFKIALDSFGPNFNKVLFCDDNPKNLVNLEQLGINTLRFDFHNTKDMIKYIDDFIHQ